MALSPQDQRFYEERLSLKSYSRVFYGTTLVGTVGVPAALYSQDFAAGTTSLWTATTVMNLAVIGFLIATMLSVVMYLLFKFLLAVGWLPARR